MNIVIKLNCLFSFDLVNPSMALLKDKYVYRSVVVYVSVQDVNLLYFLLD